MERNLFGDRGYRLLIGAIVVLGFALRLGGAQGALWLDEAWSTVLANDVGTPLGVFVGINHDNNHHLNSLWLLAVGPGAPPPLARALSIVTGTIAIALAALVGGRRSRTAGAVTALAFAISPALVTLGSEARGYAPMVLALLASIILVDRWLASKRESGRLGLMLCFGLGMLSQLTMIFGILAVTGWAFLAYWRQSGFAIAVRETFAWFAPAIAAALGVIAIILTGAYWIGDGFRFGSFVAFDAAHFVRAVVEMLGYTVGWPVMTLWLAPAALAALVLARSAGISRLEFHWLAIAAFPAMIALLQAGNAGLLRYYLLIGVALLILAAEAIGNALDRGGPWRWAAGAVLAGFVAGSLIQDIDLLRNRRGDVGAAIRAMAARSPQGGRMNLYRDSGSTMIQVAAAVDRYPLIINQSQCPAERFLFVERFGDEPDLPGPVRCGRHYARIAGARTNGMSGSHWTLYERRP